MVAGGFDVPGRHGFYRDHELMGHNIRTQCCHPVVQCRSGGDENKRVKGAPHLSC